MNKTDFLSRLRIALAPLPEEERDAAMVYYEEFFDDAGEENEQSVIAEFGSPEELAKSIVEENNRENPTYRQTDENNDLGRDNLNAPSQNNTNTFNNENTAYNYNTGGYNANGGGANPPPVQQQRNWSDGQIALFIVLLVLSSPMWIGLLAGIIGLAVGIIGMAVGLIAAVCSCAVCFLASGVVALFNDPPVGVMLLGMGFVFAGLIPLAIFPLCKLAFKGAAALVKQIGKLWKKITGRKENAQ